MQKAMLMPTLYKRYREKLVSVLNSALLWNNVKLPNNTFELQVKKYCEEVEEAIEAEHDNQEHFIEEMADVLISIGGLCRFDEKLAVEALNGFLDCIDKYILMDVLDYAPKKIDILYKRDYSNGYHH